MSRERHTKEGMEIILEALRFLQKVQVPHDKLLFYCLAVEIEDGGALYCESLLEKSCLSDA